ncbi:hypothetical protein [Idiomarina loihiensis]|uniref:AbiU2 domain-containing protein n=1 Tax=Idiomarina loihiensis TaxID=135577 RepID=UPI00384B066A
MKSRIEKIRAYAKAMIGRLIVADQKLAMLKPLFFEKELIEKWNNSYGAHGLESLRMTLYFDLVRELAAVSLDSDPRSPSIHNILQLLESKPLLDALKDEYCEPLPINWINDVDEGSKKFWEEKHREREIAENLDRFGEHHSKAKDEFKEIKNSELFKKIKDTRNKIVAHYEMRAGGEPPRLFAPTDIGLKWSDAEEYLEAIKPIMIELVLLISNEAYALDIYREQHEKVAADFWSK